MPPEAPAPTNVAPAPDAAAPTPARQERGAALIAKHVAIADKARAEEAAKTLAETDAHLAGSPSERERDPKTGHFLPAGQKPKPKKDAAAGPTLAKVPGVDPPGAPAADASGGTTKKPDEAPVGAGLGKARRLVNEGKLAEAMQLIGLDPEKLESAKWASWRHENKKVATAITEARQAVQAERAEVQRSAQQLVQELSPFIRGKQAFDKGDYEEAFQQCFGIDLNTFQRKALQSMTQPGIGKDPVVAELRQQNKLLEQKLEQFITGQQQARDQHAKQENQRRYWNGVVETIKGSDDPRIAKAGENQKFIQKVAQVMQAHYDPQTETTLPPIEAAELALEELQSEFSEWQPVFGGSSPDVHATRTRTNPAATGPSGTSARRTARAVTSLNPSEAAEASPPVKLRGRALIDYHANKAMADELRGRLNGG